MINLRASRIDQSFSLEDGGVQNFLIITLPDGTELKAPIDEDQTDKIINESVNGSSNGANGSAVQTHDAWPTPMERREVDESPVQTVGLQSPEQEQSDAQALFDSISGEEEAASEGDLINWNMLPETVLTVTMKTAFKLLSAESQMTFEDIQQLSNQVAENFGPNEWAQVQAQLAPKPRAQPQARPAIGSVAWADGSPMVAGTVPSRTVPMNDAGYPITGNDVDPGEVVASGGDTDEDGVGQL